MSTSTIKPSICQVAIVTLDVERSLRFYRELLGFRSAGYIPVRGAIAARMFGVPRIEGECHWLTGDAPFFQLELFHFTEPVSRSRSRPHDEVGYQRIAIEVAELPATLRALESLGGTLLTEILRGPGADRAWVRDPDGVLIELSSPRGGTAQARFLGISAVVDDLGKATRYFSDCLGLAPEASGEPNRERLSEEAGAKLPCPPARDGVTLSAGPYWLELNHYGHSAAPGADAQRQLTDQGLMNIALGVRKPAEFIHLYRGLLAQGYPCATEPVGGGLSHSVYVQPTSGLSVELLQLPPFFDSLWGFKPPGPIASATQSVLRFLLSRQRQPLDPSAGAA